MVPFVIFMGAGIGGVSRYALGHWIHGFAGTGFPWGTLIINISGSLLLTFIYGLIDASPTPSAEWRAFLGIGICGGFTTFSAFSYETIRLLQIGRWERGLTYVVLSVVLSLGAAIVGFRLAAALEIGRLAE